MLPRTAPVSSDNFAASLDGITAGPGPHVEDSLAREVRIDLQPLFTLRASQLDSHFVVLVSANIDRFYVELELC